MSFKNANQQIQRFVLNWGNLARTYEIIRALVDARRFNSTITEKDNGPDGKLREFKMSYMPILCDTDGSCTDSVCSTGTVVAPKQKNFILKQCTASKVYQINGSDLRLVDGNYTFSDHAVGIINAALPDIRRNLALDMAALLIANAGLQPDGNPTRRVSMANQTNGTINPTGQWEVERTFQDTGFGAPTIIGSGEVFTWQKAQIAAGTTATGLNLTRIGQPNVYYDALVAQAVGDGSDHIFAFDPQVLKFITWSKNAGMFATDVASLNNLEVMYNNGHPTLLKGVLRDPATGLAWDLNIHFEPCDDNEEGSWKFQLKLLWDIYFMPDIACNIQGLNGIFHYTTCPAVLTPCPTGDAIPAAASTTTFAWNPGFAYPLFVGRLKVAGVETTPKVNITSDADLVAMLNDASPILFTLVGANVQYTGYSAISVNLNDGDVTGTFA